MDPLKATNEASIQNLDLQVEKLAQDVSQRPHGNLLNDTQEIQ